MNYKESSFLQTENFNEIPNKEDIKIYTEEEATNKYLELFDDLINGSDDNKDELIEEIINFDMNEKAIPQEAITKSNIIPFICDKINEDINPILKEKLFRLLIQFTFLECNEVLTESFLTYIQAFFSCDNDLLPYALQCFLNIYSSKQMHDYIQENFDFSYFQIYKNEDSDVNVIQTILQIYTIMASEDGLDYSIGIILKDFAIFALESEHSELISPSLFLIYQILQNCDGISNDIYCDNFVDAINKTLYAIEPEILCPAIDICIFLIKKDYDMSALHLKNIISLITHQVLDVQYKIVELLSIMISNFDEELLEELIKLELIPSIIESFNSSQEKGRIIYAKLINLIFQNVSSRNLRRLIREKLQLIVIKWVDFDNEEIRSFILPILDKVFTEAQKAGRIDEIVMEFSENDGFHMLDDLVSMSEDPTETDSKIEEFCNKFDI